MLHIEEFSGNFTLGVSNYLCLVVDVLSYIKQNRHTFLLQKVENSSEKSGRVCLKPKTPNSKEEKVWQGQAFEDFQSAVNPPLISPTPCLKIRNMFEPVMETREQWHIFIQDAILEKCSEKGASIVHIAVDQSSTEGCVYVKCANHRSSGVAFRAIHGCWFDGRLVTVKFLTVKRYHQRFLDAIDAKEPLKSSGAFSSTIPKLRSEPINESDTDSEPEVPVVT